MRFYWLSRQWVLITLLILLFTVSSMNGSCISEAQSEKSGEEKADPACRETDIDGLKEAFENFGMVNPSLYRGAQPGLDRLHLLKKAGIVSIISFRTGKKDVEKERKISEELGLKFFHIPWKGRNKVKERHVREFLSIVSDAANLPAFVHCKRGAERTGVMVGCYRIKHYNWSADEAHKEMKQFKFRTFWFRHLKKYVFEFEKRLKEKKED